MSSKVPTVEQLSTAAELISSQNSHGLMVERFDGVMMSDGTFVLTINETQQFRINPNGSRV
jgi:hypothetical protein